MALRSCRQFPIGFVAAGTSPTGRWAPGDAEDSIEPSRGSPHGSCSSLGSRFEGKRGNMRQRNENNHSGDAVNQPGLQGWERQGRGDAEGGRGKAATAELPHPPSTTCPVPEPHRGQLGIPRDPAGRRFPKPPGSSAGNLPPFILLKPESSGPSGKQGEPE